MRSGQVDGPTLLALREEDFRDQLGPRTHTPRQNRGAAVVVIVTPPRDRRYKCMSIMTNL